MKLLNIFVILSAFFVILIVGCDPVPDNPASRYRYAHENRVPDSLRGEMAKFITETMRASSQHLTTSDYEDVDDAVEEVTDSALRVYEREVEGLEQSQGDWWKFIPYNQLTDKQKVIFDSLKVNQQ